MFLKSNVQTKKVIGIVIICIVLVVLISALIFLPTFVKNAKYNKAVKLYNKAQYTEASVIFAKLEDYKDSKEMTEKCALHIQYDTVQKLYSDGYYAEATWAFEKLGDFEFSAQKRILSELSWRKSLACVVDTDYYTAYDTYGEDTDGVYFVTPEGKVDSFYGCKGEAHLKIPTDERDIFVVSIAAGTTPDRKENLYALYSDGSVVNAKENNNMNDDSQWHNIVKISPKYKTTNIALRADGKMLYGGLKDDKYDCTWLGDLSNWQNIVDFTTTEIKSDDDEFKLVIIGVKADGTLCGITQNTRFNLNEILSEFSNVKEVRVEYYNNNSLHIVALTKDGKIQTYISGKFTEEDAKGIYSLASIDYGLTSNGDLIVIKDRSVYKSDTVYADNRFSISSDGLCSIVYSPQNMSPYKTTYSKRTTVYNEWAK